MSQFFSNVTDVSFLTLSKRDYNMFNFEGVLSLFWDSYSNKRALKVCMGLHLSSKGDKLFGRAAQGQLLKSDQRNIVTT